MTHDMGVMTRRAAVLGGLLSLALGGCAVLDERGPRELDAAYGPNPPRLEATFAAEAVSPVDAWRLYIRGSDMDGDMTYVQVWLNMPGRQFTPVRIDVDSGQARAISGFITLNTMDFGADVNRLFDIWARVSVTLEDRAGHRSEMRTHGVRFVAGAAQPPPPGGGFDERFLGRIPVEFIPRDTTGGDQPPRVR